MSMTDDSNWTTVDTSGNKSSRSDLCENPDKMEGYSKTDIIINSLVSYCKGLHDDKTDKWLKEVLDFYSKE